VWWSFFVALTIEIVAVFFGQAILDVVRVFLATERNSRLLLALMATDDPR
jgi:hypothetical protein